jgi:hypothetical protein
MNSKPNTAELLAKAKKPSEDELRLHPGRNSELSNQRLQRFFYLVHARSSRTLSGYRGLLNPIHHASTRPGVYRYKVEPYVVVVADIYAESPHVGRDGWTWYTGSR